MVFSTKAEFICYKHFSDVHLQNYIKANHTWEKCKYCTKCRASMEIGNLAEYLEECIKFEYDDPYAQGAQYNKEADFYEDRFPGVKVAYTEEYLQDELEIDYNIAKDLTSCFENEYLAEVGSIWGPTEDEYLKDGWHSFKGIIKHKIRFLFFNEAFSKTFSSQERYELNPYQVLSEVGKAIVQLRLFQSYKKNEFEIYRAIPHEKDVSHDTAKRLGSPPENLAKANRMSPAGISMFYGAFDEETCVKEIGIVSPDKTKITIGKFRNLNSLNLIDFTKLKQIPSLFDLENRDKRYIAKFIRSFIGDLSIPVKPDDSVHIDYVPTQVVTEYLKYMMPDDIHVDGIIYDSVKNKGSKCVVLFLENEDMVEEHPDNPPTSISNLDGQPDGNASLLLIKQSVKTIDIKNSF